MNPAEPYVQGDNKYLWGFESKWYHRDHHDVKEPLPFRRCGTVPHEYDVSEELLRHEGRSKKPFSDNLSCEYEKLEGDGLPTERAMQNRRVLEVFDFDGDPVFFMLYTREETLKILAEDFKKQVTVYNASMQDVLMSDGHI